MKTKVVIIEDNFYRFFTTKSLLESKLRLNVNVMGATGSREVMEMTGSVKPDLVIYQTGGVTGLLDRMEKRHTNRRNTEVTLVVTRELEPHESREVSDFVSSFPRQVRNAA